MAVAIEGEASLLNSATWAIALTCFIFIAISIFFEKAIHLAEHVIDSSLSLSLSHGCDCCGQLILKYKQTSLQAAFHRIKDELMVVGFISIALTVGQSTVAKICVPTKAVAAMPLCRKETTVSATSRLERFLAGAAPQECSKVPQKKKKKRLNVIVVCGPVGHVSDHLVWEDTQFLACSLYWQYKELPDSLVGRLSLVLFLSTCEHTTLCSLILLMIVMAKQYTVLVKPSFG
ncbi:hypothetical protein L7F22_042393 [Adiantum nelumboides]|nr:hypothetical protein [Adiantum nelumboides]